jgi:hypothetical protein
MPPSLTIRLLRHRIAERALAAGAEDIVERRANYKIFVNAILGKNGLVNSFGIRKG